MEGKKAQPPSHSSLWSSQFAPSLVILITDHFNLDGIAQLCDFTGVPYDNLSGDVPPQKARELVRYCERRSLTLALLHGISECESDLDMRPYLYLVILMTFVDSLGNHLDELCTILPGVDYESLLVKDLGFFTSPGLGAKPGIIKQAWALVCHMQANGRYDELVTAIKQTKPDFDLTIFQ